MIASNSFNRPRSEAAEPNSNTWQAENTVAQKAVTMNSEILTALTGTPTLRAALASPPEAKIQLPIRVLVSTTWAITAMTSAQTISMGMPPTAGAPLGSLLMMPLSASHWKKPGNSLAANSCATKLSAEYCLRPLTIVRLVNKIDNAMVSPRSM